MTIAEANRFYKQDKKKYQLNENLAFLNWYQEMIDNGYYAFMNVDDLQSLMDHLVIWFELKYPKRELEYDEGITDDRFQGIQRLAKVMSWEQLLFRLSHDELCLMEGGWRSNYVSVKRKKAPDNPLDWKSIRDLPNFLLFIDLTNGQVKLDEHLEGICEPGDIDAGELLEIFQNTQRENLDFGELERLVFAHQIDLELRKKILELTALKLLYSENTIPERGAVRSKRFIAECNKHIPDLELSTKEIEEIMNRDYKNEVILDSDLGGSLGSSVKKNSCSLVKKLKKKIRIEK